ncbi:MAG: hypothetical protein IT208_05395 [Chthonomonadales bacterium]|nr:hypothetical protein [Chthonomonadales bacterium]
MWRATAMLREGKHREALVAFRKLQDAAPLDARASRGATHAAWRHLEEALRLDPGLLAARFALAAARKRAGGSGP